MPAVLGRIKRFLREERGLEVVEVAVVAGLIVTVGALVLVRIGEDSHTLLQGLKDAVGAAAKPGPGGGGSPGCGIGPELALAVPLLAWLRARRSRVSASPETPSAE